MTAPRWGNTTRPSASSSATRRSIPAMPIRSIRSERLYVQHGEARPWPKTKYRKGPGDEAGLLAPVRASRTSPLCGRTTPRPITGSTNPDRRSPTPSAMIQGVWIRAFTDYLLGRWERSMARYAEIRKQAEGRRRDLPARRPWTGSWASSSGTSAGAKRRARAFRRWGEHETRKPRQNPTALDAAEMAFILRLDRRWERPGRRSESPTRRNRAAAVADRSRRRGSSMTFLYPAPAGRGRPGRRRCGPGDRARAGDRLSGLPDHEPARPRRLQSTLTSRISWPGLYGKRATSTVLSWNTGSSRRSIRPTRSAG